MDEYTLAQIQNRFQKELAELIVRDVFEHYMPRKDEVRKVRDMKDIDDVSGDA